MNNEPFSAICQFTPISVLGKLQFVIIKLSRIEACTPRSILGFFQAIRSRLGDSGYEHWLTKYLKETYGFKLAFLSTPNFLHTDDVHDGMSSRLQSFAKGAGQNIKGLPFDIKLTRGSENLIFHAFPCGETTKNGMLFVSGKNIQIGPIAAQELRAAAMAANGNLSTQANHDFDVNIGHCAFTGVERQVLQLLVEGYSDKEIAERLGRSVHTVKNRVRNMMEKVQVNKRTMLVALVTGVRSRSHHE
jgi:DNA-binding CsgD family transcriptional regulator